MKTKILWLFAALAVIIVGSVVWQSVTDSGNDIAEPSQPTQITEEEDKKPRQVNVVIDKSQSMAAYFSAAGDKDILQIITDFSHTGDSVGKVSFYGSKADLPNYALALQTASNFNADTDMKAIFKSLVKDSKSTPTAFVTDGIFSTPQGVKDLPQVTADITKLIAGNGKDLAYLIYRMTAPYSGDYWIEKTREPGRKYDKVSLNVPVRPYFVIVVGPKAQLRWIEENLHPAGSEVLAFNMHDAGHGPASLRTDGKSDNAFTEKPDSIGVPEFHFSTAADSCYLILYYPKCLAQRVKGLNPGNAVLTINGATQTNWEIANPTESRADLVFNDPISDARPGEQNRLTLDFDINRSEDPWAKYSSSDDSKIKTDISEQGKTFELSRLIEAIHNGESNNHITISIDFTQD